MAARETTRDEPSSRTINSSVRGTGGRLREKKEILAEIIKSHERTGEMEDRYACRRLFSGTSFPAPAFHNKRRICFWVNCHLALATKPANCFRDPLLPAGSELQLLINLRRWICSFRARYIGQWIETVQTVSSCSFVVKLLVCWNDTVN